MTKFKAIKSDYVIRNVENIFKSKDIDKMTKATYDVLYLMSGFIAHYDIGGFKCHYSNTSDLARDILSSTDAHDPERYIRDSFFSDSYGMEYCDSKTKVYTGLRILAEKYLPELEKADAEDARDSDIKLGRALLEKHGVTN